MLSIPQPRGTKSLSLQHADFTLYLNIELHHPKAIWSVIFTDSLEEGFCLAHFMLN